VLAAESSVDWPDEALVALAIACRSFGMFRVVVPTGAAFDVVSSTRDQGFVAPSSAPEHLRDLADRTDGYYLAHRSGRWRGRGLYQALYHHSCGGSTDRAQAVWGSNAATTVVATCAPCLDAAPRWRATLTPEVLCAAARPGEGSGIRLEVVDHTPAGRVRLVTVTCDGSSEAWSGEQLRAAVGYLSLPSTRFSVIPSAEGRDVTVEGIGYGHGVGLCNLGARSLAADGADHREILAHYYPDAELIRAR
jgi:stage II sporulation protein D